MFTGFRPETIDFLWGIRFNNNREWFLAHKQEYLDCLYNPMKELGSAVFEPLSAVPGLALHVSRIYKDARYAHGVPYKDSLWLSIRHDSVYWAEQPILYFDLHPEYYGYGFAVVAPRADALQRYRDRIAGNPDAFLRLLADMKKETGFELTGREYSRKKPCPEPRVEKYYNLKNLMLLTDPPISEDLFRPELADTVADTLEKLLPFYNFCREIF